MKIERREVGDSEAPAYFGIAATKCYPTTGNAYLLCTILDAALFDGVCS